MAGDILFDSIVSMHEDKPWGRFLDAGTGVHSMKWIQTLKTSSVTAITADIHMERQVMSNESVSLNWREGIDEMLCGNWMDQTFCDKLGKFDTILADYLIGAVEGFSPYEQDVILAKLTQHLNPGGRLYFISMNPIPDEPGNVISEIRRARDSCILLAGDKPYREFPLSWMERHLKQFNMKVIDTKSYTIIHSENSTVRQINVARSKLNNMSPILKASMMAYLDDLETRTKEALASNGGKIRLSFDYIIGVEVEN